MSDSVIEIETNDTIVITENSIDIVSVGIPGPVGPAGPIGPAGPQGIQGPVGPQGPAGADGVDGADGAQGIQGPAGPVGPAGSQGVQGPQGPAGENFVVAKVYSSVESLLGDASPTGITAGQYAVIDTGSELDVDNAKTYLWTGTAYMYITDLSGIQGIQGPAGPQGVQGPTGAQGPVGPTGPQGIQGIQGIDGRSAYQVAVDNGFAGNQTAWLESLIGPQGPAGLDGASVWIGDNAPVDVVAYPLWLRTTNGKLYGRVSDSWLELTQTGPQGPAGADGADGAQGIQGIQGIQGPAGVNTWGSLTGDMATQTDLINALDGKAPSSHAHTGVYEPANANIQTHIGSTNNPHSTSISQLSGVSISTPLADQILSYNGTNWINKINGIVTPAFSWSHTGVDVGAVDFPIASGEYIIQLVTAQVGGSIEIHFSKDGGGTWDVANDFHYTYTLDYGTPNVITSTPSVALTFLSSKDYMAHEIKLSIRQTGMHMISNGVGRTTTTMSNWNVNMLSDSATGYNYARIAYATANAVSGSLIKVWKVS